MNLGKYRRGLAPVVSEIILSAAVLTIGGGIWYFSLGYCSITTDSYIDETLELMNQAIERYTIEQVYPDFDTSTLNIYVNNYGEVDITVDLYIDSANRSAFVQEINIPSGNVERVQVDFSEDPFELFEIFQIKVYSRRQNIAYYTYTVN